jgi:hypothetical protein
MKRRACLIPLLALAACGAVGQSRQGEKTRQREQLDFSMETEIVPIERPVSLPEGALRLLEKEADVSSCMVNAKLSPGQLPASWFVGSQVHLDGPDEMDLIVLPSPLEATQPMHPAPNACFFGPYTAKFWVLRMTRNGYELALTVHTHGLGVLKSGWKGHRDIETGISTLNGTTTTLFRFDGKQYKLHNEKTKPNR